MGFIEVDENGNITEKTFAEVSKEYEAHVADLRANCFISNDRKAVELLWGGYNYSIELSRIKNPTELLDWVCHLCGKTWMDNSRIRFFIGTVGQAKKWKLQEDDP